jgi:hypothetical protein
LFYRTLQEFEKINFMMTEPDVRKVDEIAEEALTKDLKKPYEIIWHYLDVDKRVNLKGRQIKEHYRKFMKRKQLERNKIKKVK